MHIWQQKAWLASALNLVIPGLGFFYLGQLGWALFNIAFLASIYFAITWSRLIIEPIGFFLLPASLLAAVVAFSRFLYDEADYLASERHFSDFGYFVYCIATAYGCFMLAANHTLVGGFDLQTTAQYDMGKLIHPHDYIVIDTWRYHNNKPQRGELVALRNPAAPGAMIVSRIIGLPGEHIELVNGNININHERWIEPDRKSETNNERTSHRHEYDVALRHYFVLSDDRDFIEDSRLFGSVAEDSIIGRAEYVPFSVTANNSLRIGRFGIRLNPVANNPSIFNPP